MEEELELIYTKVSKYINDSPSDIDEELKFLLFLLITEQLSIKELNGFGINILLSFSYNL